MDKGSINISVAYKSDTGSFTEVMDVSGNTLETIKQRIVNRLKILTQNDALLAEIDGVASIYEEQKGKIAVTLADEAIATPVAEILP